MKQCIPLSDALLKAFSRITALTVLVIVTSMSSRQIAGVTGTPYYAMQKFSGLELILLFKKRANSDPSSALQGDPVGDFVTSTTNRNNPTAKRNFLIPTITPSASAAILPIPVLSAKSATLEADEREGNAAELLCLPLSQRNPEVARLGVEMRAEWSRMGGRDAILTDQLILCNSLSRTVPQPIISIASPVPSSVEFSKSASVPYGARRLRSVFAKTVEQQPSQGQPTTPKDRLLRPWLLRTLMVRESNNNNNNDRQQQDGRTRLEVAAAVKRRSEYDFIRFGRRSDPSMMAAEKQKKQDDKNTYDYIRFGRK